MSTTAENITGFNPTWAKKPGLGATLAQLPPESQRIAETIIAAQTPQPRDSEYAHSKRQGYLNQGAKLRQQHQP